jgi:BirA family biotin operon repressor/biotin-[acetyl-CoA-carboxylase] ligase
MKFSSAEEMSRGIPSGSGVLLPSVDSTNLFCLREFSNLPDGALVVAREQTQGRGRMGRRWFSPKGNLYASLALKAQTVAGAGHVLTLPHLGALAAFEVLRECGCGGAWIKWPNDLYVDNKKIGGILGEAIFQGQKLAGLVLGIGVNINMQSTELGQIGQPATSLWAEKGTQLRVEDFADAFYERFQALYCLAQRSGFSKVYPRWRSAAGRLLGQEVEVIGHKEVEGKVADYGEDGSLIVEVEGQGRRVFYSSSLVTGHKHRPKFST